LDVNNRRGGLLRSGMPYFLFVKVGIKEAIKPFLLLGPLKGFKGVSGGHGEEDLYGHLFFLSFTLFSDLKHLLVSGFHRFWGRS
jgi:hypothetical protein